MSTHRIPPDVRAAIGAFLNETPRDAQPFAISEARSAVRRIFPQLEISDTQLSDAITSEALTAGVDINYDTPQKSSSIDRWDDEVGAAAGRDHHR